MKYPGKVIRIGEKDAAVVKALKRKLNSSLAAGGDSMLKLDTNNPSFGPRTREVVRLFQARNVDVDGVPLKQDGEVGPLTWSVLFGESSVPGSSAPADNFLEAVLSIAAGEEAKKVREQPKNSNKGPEVNEYLRRTGVRPGLAWCCAFVYWCFDEAAKLHDRGNPMVKTAGCLFHWNHAQRRGARRVLKAQAINDPSLVRSGMIFIIDHGGGLGHTGLIERVDGGLLTTIEGNTDASKTREGGGVYRLRRKIVDINKGYIDYAGV
jgi:hypothetical protein